MRYPPPGSRCLTPSVAAFRKRVSTLPTLLLCISILLRLPFFFALPVYFFLAQRPRNAEDDEEQKNLLLGCCCCCCSALCPLILNKNLCCLHLHDTPTRSIPRHPHPTLLHSKGISIYQSLKFHGWLSLSLSLPLPLILSLSLPISAISAKLAPKVKIEDLAGNDIRSPCAFPFCLFTIGFEFEYGIQFDAKCVWRVWKSSVSVNCEWIANGVANWARCEQI